MYTCDNCGEFPKHGSSTQWNYETEEYDHFCSGECKEEFYKEVEK